MSFQCVIVTPEQQVLDEQVTQVILPAHDGLVGIMTDRAPLLAKLGLGPLRVDPASGPSRYFLVEGGVAQMKDNHLTILTDRAEASSEINAESARAEYAEATARRITDSKSFEDRQRQLQRSRMKQQLVGKQ
ncbi:MAG: ATP synthase F1 subunit epsilon [Tepidisphaeraceae bacterium]